MRNRLFIPDFLCDFYTNRGSIGTISALSNVSKAELRKIRAKRTFKRLFQYLTVLCSKSRKVRETFFGKLVAGLVLY